MSEKMDIIRQVSVATNWDEIASVINHYVITSTAAYPCRQLEGKFFYESWKSNPGFPFYEVLNNDAVIGFCYMRPFHPADSMNEAVLLTYFIAPSYTGKGIGKQLLEVLLRDGRKMGKTNFLVNISSDNEGSMNFHREKGFVECGRFRSVGKKNGKEFDMVWMQKVESTSSGS